MIVGVVLGLLIPHVPVGFTVPRAETVQMLFAVGAGLLTFIGVIFSLLFPLHGLTSAPLVGVYHRWYDSHAEAHPKAAEAAATTMPRQRRHLGAAGLEQPLAGERPS